jgi:hypothetical protein
VARPERVKGCKCDSALLARSGTPTAGIESTTNSGNVTSGTGTAISGPRFKIDAEGGVQITFTYSYPRRTGRLWCKLKQPASNSSPRRALPDGGHASQPHAHEYLQEDTVYMLRQAKTSYTLTMPLLARENALEIAEARALDMYTSCFLRMYSVMHCHFHVHAAFIYLYVCCLPP